MRQRDQIDGWLGQIEYKPGWRLEWEWTSPDWPFGAPMLLQIRWHMLVPDAYEPERLVRFTSAWVIPYWEHLDEESLVREVYRLTLRAEEHEAGEFFQYKGARPFDPHRSVIGDGRHG